MRAYELQKGDQFRWRATIVSQWQHFVVTKEFDGDRMEARPLDSIRSDRFNEEADVEKIDG